MTDPLVSILVPTYNGERFLKAALRSALTQTYREIEVLVGDDASTDRTPAILADVAAGDPRVRIVQHESNLGALGNWTFLLGEARGEYVKYVLHDDVLANDCVRELVRGMQAAPETVMAFSRRVLIDEDGRPVAGHEFPKLRDRPGVIDGRELGDAALESCTNLIGEATTVLFRRSAVDPAGWWQADGRQLDVLADLKLWLMLLARGPAFYTPHVLSRFRSHPNQNSWDPQLIARGVRDWPKLIDWGVRAGFLADPVRQRTAYARALLMAAARVAELIGGPDHGPGLEAVFLATARLAELGAGSPVDPATGLQRRAHGPQVLQLFSQELDVWAREHPVALAAPAVDAREMTATVQALRDVHAAGVAKRLMVALPEHLMPAALPLLDAALAAGPGMDVETVATDAPATLLARPWLAVAPRTSTWHDGQATAVWAIDAPAQ